MRQVKAAHCTDRLVHRLVGCGFRMRFKWNASSAKSYKVLRRLNEDDWVHIRSKQLYRIPDDSTVAEFVCEHKGKLPDESSESMCVVVKNDDRLVHVVDFCPRLYAH